MSEELYEWQLVSLWQRVEADGKVRIYAKRRDGEERVFSPLEFKELQEWSYVKL